MEISWEPSQLLFRTKTFQLQVYFSFEIFRNLLKKKSDEFVSFGVLEKVGDTHLISQQRLTL